MTNHKTKEELYFGTTSDDQNDFTKCVYTLERQRKRRETKVFKDPLGGWGEIYASKLRGKDGWGNNRRNESTNQLYAPKGTPPKGLRGAPAASANTKGL